MADRYLLESSLVDGYLLEDGSGVLLLEVPTATVGSTYDSAPPYVDAKRRNALNSGFVTVAGSLLLTTLAVVATAATRLPYAVPVLKRPALQQDQVINRLPLGATVTATPFVSEDTAWTLKAKFNQPDQVLNNLILSTVVTPAPFVNEDTSWTAKSKAQPPDQPPNTLLAGIPQQMGARPVDQPNPAQRAKFVLHETGYSHLALGIPQQPALRPTDLTQTFKRQYLQVDQTQANTPTPASSTADTIHGEYRVPVFARKYLQVEQVQPFAPYAPGAATAPFAQDDQPAPLLRARWLLHEAGQLGLTLGIPPPAFFPTDLAQLFKARYLQVDQVQPLVAFLTATAAPLLPTDLAQTFKARYLQIEQLPAAALNLVAPPAPFSQTDWFNTTKARYLQVEQVGLSALTIPAIAPSPFTPYDSASPYPRARAVEHAVGFTILAQGIPQQIGSLLTDQPNPVQRPRFVLHEPGFTILPLGIPQAPLQLPTDITQVYKARYLQIEQLPAFALTAPQPQPLPFSLLDQPNPVLRAKFVLHDPGFTILPLGITPPPVGTFRSWIGIGIS